VLKWGPVCLLGVLVAAGCAKATAVGGEDAGGVGVGGNGMVDLAGGVGGGDLGGGLRCGDGVCTPANGESCESCPADCGVCPGCPQGYADCNHSMADGCETPIDTTMNCGACGLACQQVGGTNACVMQGTTYVCQPTCDATHADCNLMPNDGCEVDLTTPGNCGACGHACMNANGTTVCTTQGAGWFCDPTCTSPYGACASDKTSGCTTNLGNDVDHCGDCNRPCSTANTTARSCAGGVCKPTCAAPWSDCSDPAAPGADDGCETNGTADPGENDNACPGQNAPDTGEGSSNTVTTNRILPSGDVDVFHVHLTEGSHVCVPGTGQSYNALVQVTPPAGTNLQIQVNTSSCNNTWTSYNTTGVCVSWNGTCGATDNRDVWVQVFGVGGANSCGDYTLTITYASEGNKAPGC
jgi:hypothetical protein